MEVIVSAVLGIVAGVASMWGYMALRASREREARLRRVDEIGRELERRKAHNRDVARERMAKVTTEAEARAMLEEIWK